MVASNLHRLEGAESRKLACDILYSVLVEKHTLSDALAIEPIKAKTSQDFGFIKTMLNLCLRHLGEVDYRLFEFIARPKPLKDTYALMILRLAATQLLFMGREPYAVINLAVEIAKQNSKAKHFASLTNAVLRKLAKAPKKELPLKINTPDWLWQEWLTTYGEQTADKIATAHLTDPEIDLSFKQPPPDLTGELLALNTLRLKKKTKIESLAGFEEGTFWVQDVAASLVAPLLGNVEGKAVLEYGAAPGGKSAQLVYAGAKLTALELSPERAEVWQENMARLKLKADLVIADGKTYQAPAPYDFILVDAPCSGTGTSRRHPDLVWLKDKKQVQALQKEQSALLERATKNLNVGGVLVYAVCSLLHGECLDIINHYLKNYPYMTRKPIQAEEISFQAHLLTPEGDLRSLPFHRPNLLKQKIGSESVGMDGFFIARLQRH